jgi:hypothetical protein
MNFINKKDHDHVALSTGPKNNLEYCLSVQITLLVFQEFDVERCVHLDYFAVIVDFECNMFKRKDVEDDSRAISWFRVSAFTLMMKKPNFSDNYE